MSQTVRAVGGEVLLGVAEPSVVPDGARPPGLRVVSAGRGSDLALRAAALNEADGDFLALLGEERSPGEEWWSSYEAAFAGTDADVLYGPPYRGAPSPDNCVFRRE